MSEQRKKKLKALKRAQQEAARVYRAELGEAEAPISPAGALGPVAMDQFRQAYGELISATVELYRRLDPQDPLYVQVREALAHAQRVASSVMTDAEADAEVEVEIDVDIDLDISAGPIASTSVELVRIQTAPGLRLTHNPPSVGLVPRMPPRLLPDEASLVRYARVRRATHRWPDEAVMTRYLRERQLPDESTLHRHIRRRRELYQLYG
jgi:hypothetical protein